MIDVIERARHLRATIEALATTLDDETALDNRELFPAWDGDGITYQLDDRVRYDGALWRCLMSHVSQATWKPTYAPSLWARVLIPEPEVIPEWQQPESTNPYNKGDKVRHNDKIWVSDIDGNVWEPGIYGWTEVLE